jgi:hypothetical protein
MLALAGLQAFVLKVERWLIAEHSPFKVSQWDILVVERSTQARVSKRGEGEGGMILGEVFERFIAESPFSVMLRVLLEQSLPAEAV